MSMFMFILSMILFLGAIATGVYFAISMELSAAGIGAALLVVGLIFFGWSGVREVPTNSVGVPTAFGSVEPAVNPGFHWMAPWTRVNIIDKTVQTTYFTGGFDKNGVCTNGLDVRIGGQQQACGDMTIKWQVTDAGAPVLFKQYSNGGDVMSSIQNSLVITDLQTVANKVLGDYNPIQDVALTTGAGNSQFSTFGPLIEAQMKQLFGQDIKVVGFNMSLLHYDTATQTRLNAIQQQYGDTAIALELLKTNQAQAKANAAIGTPSPSQMQYLCFQLIQTAEKTGYMGLPGSLSCGTSSGTTIVSAHP